MKKNTKQTSQQKISLITKWLRTEPYSVDESGKVTRFKMVGYDENGVLIEEVFNPTNKILRRTYFQSKDDCQYQMTQMIYYYYEGDKYLYHLVIYEDGEIELIEGDDPIAFISDMCKACLIDNNEDELKETEECFDPSKTIPQ